MPNLPSVQDFGRPVPANSQRAIASVSPAAAGAVGAAVEGAGQELKAYAFRMAEREATAAAKDADTLAADRIRDLLYNPESGFLNANGANAVNGRENTIAQLDGLLESMGGGLNAAAKRKFEDSLNGRIERAKNSIDGHVSTERETWVNGASAARIESALQDSIFNVGETDASLEIIQGEVLDIAGREGWSQEQTNLELEKATSKLYSDQILAGADADPIAAMEYLRANQDNMSPADVANLEAKLRPEIETAIGRRTVEEAFAQGADMSSLLTIASDTLGMNETDQNAVLKEYLAAGGQNIDPAQTAWCAAFINATLAKAGINGTGSNMARSFLNWGEAATQPQPGDVVVLERGDPPFGHVGIFEGFNEDGSIRITGGNQGGANNGGGGVTQANYPASRVLGYRRAPSSGDDIDPTQIMKDILAIENPRTRQAALSEYNLRMSVYEGQQTAQVSAATNEIFQFIESGGRVDDVPQDTRQAVGMTAMSALRTYEGKLASGAPIETNPETYLNLRAMQASDPDAFRGVNLLEYVDRLSKSDFKSFADQQLGNGEAPTTVAASTLMTVASRHMAAAGIDTTPEAGTPAANQVASIQTGLLRWQDKFVEENGKPPTQTEIDERVALELRPIFYDPIGAFNLPTNTTGFKGFEDIEITVETLDDLRTKDGVIKFDGEELPSYVVRDMVNLIIDEGGEITMDNIMDKYFDALIANGGRRTGPTATDIWGEVQGPMPIGG